jgi:hypothetical protein
MSKFLAKWVGFLWLWVNGVKKSINGYCIRTFQPYIYAVYRYHCKFLTTTVLQPKDTISITRCDIYHLLSAEIYNICAEAKILKSFRNPFRAFVSIVAKVVYICQIRTYDADRSVTEA